MAAHRHLVRGHHRGMGRVRGTVVSGRGLGGGVVPGGGERGRSAEDMVARFDRELVCLYS